MPLSEHEERILAEIEQQLAHDDPRFVARADRVSRGRPASGPGRLGLAIAGFVLGFLCLLGLVIHQAFGFVGIGLMFVSLLIGVPELRRRRERAIDPSVPF